MRLRKQVQPIRFNILCAVPLPALQKCSDDAMAALTDIVGASLFPRVRAEDRTYCALQFATVVRPFFFFFFLLFFMTLLPRVE